MINENSDCYNSTLPKEVLLTQVGVMWAASEIAERINTNIFGCSS